ncbi:MAG: hypothetical protein GX221_01470 [Candidatus Riflebacteria bacterium]|nr:hypothetical protein [Candidatus Riflebacteria bacterium]
MKVAAGYLNFPEWKEEFKSEIELFSKSLLRSFPILGKENWEPGFFTLDFENFSASVKTGIVFDGGSLPENCQTESIITCDPDLAIRRLKDNKVVKTGFYGAMGSSFNFFRIFSSEAELEKPAFLWAQNDPALSFALSLAETEDKTLQEALHEAQWNKLAEAKPTLHIHGFLSVKRLILQAAKLFGILIPQEQIYVKGIADLDLTDLRILKERGYSVRMVARADCSESLPKASVEPCVLSGGSIFSKGKPGNETLLVKSDCGKESFFCCPGNLNRHKISGIIADLEESERYVGELKFMKELKEFQDPFYVSFKMINQRDTFAEAANLFKEHDIGILAFSSEAAFGESEISCEKRTFLITEKTERKKLEKALKSLKKKVPLAETVSVFPLLNL